MKYVLLYALGYCCLLYACTPAMYKVQEHDFPEPVNTTGSEVLRQERRAYIFGGFCIDNKFDGARLNGLIQVNDSTYEATILPENKPINPSPYYAFRMTSSTDRTVYLRLRYDGYKHRYWPKRSNHTRKDWMSLDSTNVQVLEGEKLAEFRIDMNAGDTVYIASQEIINSSDNLSWSQQMAATHEQMYLGVAGKSILGKDILRLDVYDDDPAHKPVMIILSRQHPPEVTGYWAMQAFVEEVMNDQVLSRAFREKYRILIYPMINPDGVDEGHWRHNMGGVDLNRDWASYRQPEIKAVVEDMISRVREYENKVLVGIDFHSTQRDIYYTLSDNLVSVVDPVKDVWLEAIDTRLPEYTPLDSPDPLSKPISKTWFYKQFGAEGITYEVGDNTEQDFVVKKAKVAAQEMMKLLLLAD